MGRNKKSKKGQTKELEDNLDQKKELESTIKKPSENLEEPHLASKSSISIENVATHYHASKTEPKANPQGPKIAQIIPAISDVIISQYAYDQTENNIKILIEMPGIGGYPKDKISLTASEFSFRFYVKEFDNKNWLLVVHCLAHEIIPPDVDFIVKKDKVTLVLTKKNHFKWVCLTPTEETQFEEWVFILCGMVRQILGQYVTIDIEGVCLAAYHIRHILRSTLLNPIVHYENLGLLPQNLKCKTLEDVMNYAKKMIRDEPSRKENYVLLGSALLEKLEQRNKRIDKVKYDKMEEKVTQLSKNPNEKLAKANPEINANKPFVMESPRVQHQKACEPQIPTAPFTHNNTSLKSVTSRLVACLEERGLSYFADKQYQSAIETFTEIIDLIPEDSIAYSRRAGCYLKLERFQEALNDGQIALHRNPKDTEGCLIVGESLIALGKQAEALKTLEKATQFDSVNQNITNLILLSNKLSRDVENADEAFNKDDFDGAAASYNAATKYAVASRMLHLKAAECLILANKVDKANEMVGNLAGGRITESDAHCIRGMIHFYQDEKYEAFEQFDLCLTLEEGHVKCQELYQISRDIYFAKEIGDKYFYNGKYSLALHSFLKGMNINHKNIKIKVNLYFNLGQTNFKLLNLADAIKNFTSAINLNGKYEKALLKRAECYCEINQFHEAVLDLEIACKHSDNYYNKELLRKAKSKLKTASKVAVDFCSLSKDMQDKALALIKKEKGNELFNKGDYEEALELYSIAVKLDPSCPSYYANRSASLLKLERYSEALKDSVKTIELDENYLKGYLRKGKIQLIMGKGEDALQTINQGLKIDPSNKDLNTERKNASDFIQCKRKGEDAFQKHEFIAAEKYFGKALDTAKDCSELAAKYLEVWLYCENRLCGDKRHKIYEFKERLRYDDHIYHYIRALENFLNSHNMQSVENNMKDVIKEVESFLSQDPNHSKAKNLKKKAQLIWQLYSEGQKARASNNLAEAIALFQKALLVDEFSKKLNGQTLCEIGECYMMQKDFLKAIEQFKLSIELNDKNSSPYIKRAMCYDHLERWQESVNDYEKACNLDYYSSINRKLLNDAKLKLKKSTRKDYYKVLGLDPNATMEAIRKAYKRLAKEHHPDRLSGEEDKIKVIGEEKFKEINEAYNILSDPLKRERYDNGEEETTPNFDPRSFFFNMFGFGTNFYSSHDPFNYDGYDSD